MGRPAPALRRFVWTKSEETGEGSARRTTTSIGKFFRNLIANFAVSGRVRYSNSVPGT